MPEPGCRAPTAIYPMTDRVSIVALTTYSRLLGDAADSPLVSSEGSADQLSAMLGLSYRW